MQNASSLSSQLFKFQGNFYIKTWNQFYTEDYMIARITTNHTTMRPLDPVPATHLQAASTDLALSLTSIINSLLTSDQVSSLFKSIWVRLLLFLLDADPSVYNQGHSTETALLSVTESLHNTYSFSLTCQLPLTLSLWHHQMLLSSLSDLGISSTCQVLILSSGSQGGLEWLSQPHALLEFLRGQLLVHFCSLCTHSLHQL